MYDYNNTLNSYITMRMHKYELTVIEIWDIEWREALCWVKNSCFPILELLHVLEVSMGIGVIKL